MKQTHVVAKTLLVNAEGQTLLLRRSATAPRRALEWDIPGGHVDDGEYFVGAATREVQEETGIVLSKEALQLIYTHTALVNNVNVCWLFFAGNANVTEVKLSNEHDESRWATLDEAIEAIDYDVQHDMLVHVRDNNLLESK